jgi:DNA-directed RNA polymerase subunit M/transcription elongation factor TFIIS
VDYQAAKVNENEHPHTQHVVIQEDIDKNDDSNVNTVREKDNADKSGTEHDAKEEGRNKYFSTRKTRKKDEIPEEGRVIPLSSGGFNITI